MVSTFAVAIAATLQMVLGISVFIDQRSDLCSTAPTLASWLFLIAFLDILLDVAIFPMRYMHLPYFCQLIAETVLAVLVTEFASLVVWCTIEKITCKLSKSMLIMAGLPPNVYIEWERYILGTITTCISLTFLLCVGHATYHFHVLRKKSLRMYRKISNYVFQLWQNGLKIISNEKESVNNSAPLQTQKCQLPADSESVACEVLYRPRQYQKRSRSRSRSRSRKSR